MTRKLFALVVLIVAVASLAACETKKLPFGPTPVETASTTPPTTTPPLPSNQCWDREATNYGGPIPCTYSSQGEVGIGSVGFSEMRSGNVAGVAFPAKDYAGVVEVRVQLGQSGTHNMVLVLTDTVTNKTIRTSNPVSITGSGTMSLPHDGTACVAFVKNAGTVVLSGRATFVYKKE